MFHTLLLTGLLAFNLYCNLSLPLDSVCDIMWEPLCPEDCESLNTRTVIRKPNRESNPADKNNAEWGYGGGKRYRIHLIT